MTPCAGGSTGSGRRLLLRSGAGQGERSAASAAPSIQRASPRALTRATGQRSDRLRVAHSRQKRADRLQHSDQQRIGGLLRWRCGAALRPGRRGVFWYCRQPVCASPGASPVRSRPASGARDRRGINQVGVLLGVKALIRNCRSGAAGGWGWSGDPASSASVARARVCVGARASASARIASAKAAAISRRDSGVCLRGVRLRVRCGRAMPSGVRSSVASCTRRIDQNAAPPVRASRPAIARTPQQIGQGRELHQAGGQDGQHGDQAAMVT